MLLFVVLAASLVILLAALWLAARRFRHRPRPLTWLPYLIVGLLTVRQGSLLVLIRTGAVREPPLGPELVLLLVIGLLLVSLYYVDSLLLAGTRSREKTQIERDSFEQRVAERAAELEAANARLMRAVTERQQAEEAENEQRRLAEALRNTASVLSSTLTLDDVFERLLENLEEVVPHHAADITLIENNIAHVAHSRGYEVFDAEAAVKDLTFDTTRIAHMRQIIATGQAALIPDVRTYSDWVTVPHTAWIRSHLTVPIRLHGDVIGFLNINSAEPGFFTQQHAERLQAFADQTASAVQNARLWAQAKDELNQRRRAEMALRRSEEQLRATLDALADAVHVVDTDLRVTLMNQSFLEWNRQYGLTAEPLGLTPFELFPFLPPSARDDYQYVLETGQIKLTQEQVQIGHAHIYTETRKIPLVGPQGVYSIVTVIRDTTDQHLAQQGLRHRDAILEAMALAAEGFLRTESWTDHIEAVLERLGRALEVDRVYLFENHLGAEGETLSSQRYEWVAPGIASQMDNSTLQNVRMETSEFVRWNNLLAAGQPVYGRVRELPADEQPTLLAQDIRSILSMPVFVGATWWGAIGFDVCTSERDWDEIEIEALRVAANMIGAAIERELSERQVLQLELERERKAILASFIRDTSHEFANPLSVIKNDLYLAHHTVDPARQLQYLDHLNGQIYHIEKLVQGLLTMSRLDSGIDLRHEPIHVPGLLQEVCDALSTATESRQHTLVFEGGTELPPIVGDCFYLHQALACLVENAVLYTPPGGTITLRASANGSGDYLVIEVCDTGIGIGPDDLPHVFERFFRVDQARAERGAGLGLSIAHAIVTQHGGTLEVESLLNAGSVFRVSLPIARP